MSNFQKVCDSTVGEQYFYRVHESGLPIYVIPKKHSATYAMFVGWLSSSQVIGHNEMAKIDTVL